MDVTLKGLTEDDVLRLSDALGEPEWLRDRRLEAFKAFSDLEWPHRRVEEWRYTDPARISLERPLGTAVSEPLPREGSLLAAAGDLAGSATISNGGVRDLNLSPDAQALGVTISDLSVAAAEQPELVREHLGAVVGTATKFDAVSLAALTGSVVVHVPPNVTLDRPIGISVEATMAGTFVPRVLVVLGHHAHATAYIDHRGDAEATVVETVEAVVGDEANLSLVTSQQWGMGVDHVAVHKGQVHRNGAYRHLEVTLGGRTVYIRPDVRLIGEGADGELLGVYFTDEGQHVEHRSLIHHDASHTTSESVYKGALQGDSRATWYGNIRIEPHAKATSSDETNRNLILTDKARANTIPFLEILTADVSACGHHSSVGQLDEMQLFYLTSRGIPREEAVRMLLFGFFAEITDRIDLPGVSAALLAEIEREIRQSDLVLMDPRRVSR